MYLKTQIYKNATAKLVHLILFFPHTDKKLTKVTFFYTKYQ